MPEKIITTEYSDEMQKSYMNYSMSVITARAIPDARDGLKPVQRRVLYDMGELHLGHDKPHRKSARIVGDTMGKYHPHGDSSIYETLVVLSQDFKKGMALVDGHGNFGSIEGDGAAAMRYTEARLQKFTQEVYLKDLDKTVNFISNYDETEKEPEVLPVRVPNLLINGAEGIAVGMSTSIPTHNLGEVIDTVLKYIDNNDATNMELLEVLHGPDFPTGGIIANKSELPEIYETGQGKVKVRARMEVELGRRKVDKDKLVITEIPYTMIGTGINKCLVDIADLVESKKLSDVTDISNQSSKEGIRIVLELRRDADIDKIKNILYKKTKLEDTLGVNMLAIVNGRPETLSLRGILKNYLDFQYENNTKKYKALLEKELHNKEVKSGLLKAIDVIDTIIAVLRGSQNIKDAKACLMTGDISKIKFKMPGFEELAKELNFTEVQADAILEMRLYKLINLELNALQKEYKETLKKIKEYNQILSSRAVMDSVIKEDLLQIKEEFATPRKTTIEDGKEAVYVETVEAPKEVLFVLDKFGYCKLLEKSIYDRNRETVDTDNAHVIPVMTDDKICFITDAGNMHQIKVNDIPYGKMKDKGTPIDNLSKYDGMKERLLYVDCATRLLESMLIFVTENAMVKRVSGLEFATNNKTVAATKLKEDDKLIAVVPVIGLGDVVLKSVDGYFLRFPINEISELKKNSNGVRGMKLEKGDKLDWLIQLDEDSENIITYKDKPVYLSRMKISKRDGKGSKK